jgi:hypothetical protein
VCIDTFSSNVVGTLYYLKGSFIFKINLKTTNDKKKINSNNKFMFVINNPKETTFMIIFKKFQQKIFFICMIYPVYGKEKLN